MTTTATVITLRSLLCARLATPRLAWVWSLQRSRTAHPCALARSTACGGSGRRWRRRGAAAELFFLGLNELTIVGRIEVKKRPAGSKMLNENPADHPGGTGREYRHRKRADRRSESREAFHKAPHTDHGSCRGARWDHRPCQAS